MAGKRFELRVWPATSLLTKLLLIFSFASIVYGSFILARILPLVPHTSILVIASLVVFILALVAFLRAYTSASRRIVARHLPESTTYLELEVASRLTLGLLLVNVLYLIFLLTRSVGELMEPENFAAIMALTLLYVVIYWNALMCAFNVRPHLLDMKIVGSLTARQAQPDPFYQ